LIVVAVLTRDMLDSLACTCEAADCDRSLGADELMLAMTTGGGERRAHECACGTVTVTVVST
jgi:hypothetical protein